MTHHKKAPSIGSVQKLLQQAEHALQAYSKRVGPIPKMPASIHEAAFRNHLRMRTSAK